MLLNPYCYGQGTRFRYPVASIHLTRPADEMPHASFTFVDDHDAFYKVGNDEHFRLQALLVYENRQVATLYFNFYHLKQ